MNVRRQMLGTVYLLFVTLDLYETRSISLKHYHYGHLCWVVNVGLVV